MKLLTEEWENVGGFKWSLNNESQFSKNSHFEEKKCKEIVCIGKMSSKRKRVNAKDLFKIGFSWWWGNCLFLHKQYLDDDSLKGIFNFVKLLNVSSRLTGNKWRQFKGEFLLYLWKTNFCFNITL